MKKKITWTVTGLLLLSGIGFSAYYLPYWWPGYYFDHQAEYKQFSIHSDRPINRGVTFILEEVSTKLEVTKLFSRDFEFNIYFCYDPEKYARFARETGMNPNSQGMTIEPLGYVFLNLKQVGEVGRQYGNRYPYSLVSGSATHILAHELTHVLFTDQLGMFKSPDLASWKREGYAEYAASKYLKHQDTTYSFSANVNKYFAGEYKDVKPSRRHYIKNELIVEYLLDVKNVLISRFFTRSFALDTLLSELQDWAKKQKGNMVK